MNNITTITSIEKRGWMWMVCWSDGTTTAVTVHKTAHNDSRKWNAMPLLRCSAGSIPLEGVSRNASTRREAIAAAARAFRIVDEVTA
jgi:hypothetical protein